VSAQHNNFRLIFDLASLGCLHKLTQRGLSFMVQTLSKTILTAGPSITDLEIEYGLDAVKNGWNDHWGDYLKKFESFFSQYVGVKHGMATSSCTGAMHLALLALGIGEGDEVIVPEITWIATASAVVYTGAKPVFCDVDKDSWTMLPESVEKLITSKTKAIMPVHIYGHPCDMEPLWVLAKKHNLYIIEDAAQSIGAEYNGQKTGSLGDAAGFSFQGAKAIVTGEGGILVSSNDALMDRARVLGDHGRSKTKVLYNEEIGYKYKMSNVQAAIGLAQIERVEEIVAKKIQIYKWYQERLSDVKEISLNTQKPWAKNIYWMTSIILSHDVNASRDDFMKALSQRSIDSRPVFYPLSSFPMFEDCNHNNALFIGHRGINLPSGHNRTEEEIDYVCSHIKSLIQKTNNSYPLKGWLGYREETVSKLHACKQGSTASDIAFTYQGDREGHLKVITQKEVDSDSQIETLAAWRKKAQEFFPSQFHVTAEGTKIWLKKAVIDQSDRILFFILNAKGEEVGHVGLFRFDYQKKSCELDNVVRGVDGINQGIIEGASRSLMHWAKEFLGIEIFYLQVLSTNDRAVRLYQRLGFSEISRRPLKKVLGKNGSRYTEALGDLYESIKVYNVVMKNQ
jgi:perosamine synthetase